MTSLLPPDMYPQNHPIRSHSYRALVIACSLFFGPAFSVISLYFAFSIQDVEFDYDASIRTLHIVYGFVGLVFPCWYMALLLATSGDELRFTQKYLQNINLKALPDTMQNGTFSALGCRRRLDELEGRLYEIGQLTVLPKSVLCCLYVPNIFATAWGIAGLYYALGNSWDEYHTGAQAWTVVSALVLLAHPALQSFLFLWLRPLVLMSDIYTFAYQTSIRRTGVLLRTNGEKMTESSESATVYSSSEPSESYTYTEDEDDSGMETDRTYSASTQPTEGSRSGSDDEHTQNNKQTKKSKTNNSNHNNNDKVINIASSPRATHGPSLKKTSSRTQSKPTLTKHNSNTAGSGTIILTTTPTQSGSGRKYNRRLPPQQSNGQPKVFNPYAARRY